MSASDFSVVSYKVLAFLYQCIKDGVKPTYEKAEEITEVNRVYWETVLSDLVDRGFVKANVIKPSDSTRYGDVRITSDGVDYLEENPKMRKAKEFLGSAFDVALHVAIEALKAI